MKKVSIEDVEIALRQNDIPPDKVKAVTARILELVDVPKEPKAKKSPNQLVLVATAEADKLEETPMFVVKISETTDHNSVPTRLRAAAAEHNQACDNHRGRGRKPVKIESLGEAVERLKPKLLKAQGLRVMQKSPAIIVITNNQL